MSAELLLATLAVTAPFLGALVVAVVHREWQNARLSAGLAIVFTGIPALLVGWLWWIEAALTWRVTWIAPLGIGFGWRLDPFSMFFALMVAFFALVTMLYSAAYLPRMLAAYDRQFSAALFLPSAARWSFYPVCRPVRFVQYVPLQGSGPRSAVHR